ncbi:hypothetical protein DQ04_18061000 [Trypanosoma grayi]|uniref:hypothetical protein n=1 Tax=Trypanosoma grayi TaxID=71804 RepID=UPI0004F450CA|nr:hypothetical protein DQ04_18061000 [Trypanosoma grayi]KEG05831.1 hypothetical protein DQ04_18061000 [Trypanosoma grayi]
MRTTVPASLRPYITVPLQFRRRATASRSVAYSPVANSSGALRGTTSSPKSCNAAVVSIMSAQRPSLDPAPR